MGLRVHSLRISLWKGATLGWGQSSNIMPLHAPVACGTLSSPPSLIKEFGGSQRQGSASGSPTDNNEDLPFNVSLDVDAAAALRVVGATEAGDVHHAALVDVHHTGCEGRERGAWLRLVQGGPRWPRIGVSGNGCTWAN